jgi:hypothetical protein
MTRPPRAAEWLLHRLLDDSSREAVLGDLHEEFELVSRRRGTAAARYGYAAGVVYMRHDARSSRTLPQP